MFKVNRMGNLYIIGNGFDLHFELKTKTVHFLECLKKQYIYNEVESALDVLNSYGMDWCDYEQSLNDVDLDEIEFQNETYPDYLSDRESDRDGGILNMQMYVDSISESINKALKEMVFNANKDAQRLMRYRKYDLFKSGDAILSFNYTSTIEYLFDIPKDVPIYHIHGCYEEGTPLIFGYKRNTNSYNNKWIGTQDEDVDFYIGQQRQVVYSFYTKWEKQLQLQGLMNFLSQCSNIDNVVVLGHSMSFVDAEYMEQIERVICPTYWNVSYFADSDSYRIQQQNYSFNNKIKFFKLATLL